MAKKTKVNRSRRWFANASGWGLSFSLGSGEAKQKRSITGDFVDSKVQSLQSVISGNAFTHNTIYTLNPLGQISQGTANGNRIGDKIRVRYLSISGLFSNQTASNVSNERHMRILLVASTARYNPGAAPGSGLGASDLYFGTTSGLLNANVDPRKAHVLCDEVVTVKSRVSGAVASEYFTASCKLDSHFEYATGLVYGVAANLYWVFIPYEAGGSTGTTQLGQLELENLTIFDDQ